MPRRRKCGPWRVTLKLAAAAEPVPVTEEHVVCTETTGDGARLAALDKLFAVPAALRGLAWPWSDDDQVKAAKRKE